MEACCSPPRPRAQRGGQTVLCRTPQPPAAGRSRRQRPSSIRAAPRSLSVFACRRVRGDAATSILGLEWASVALRLSLEVGLLSASASEALLGPGSGAKEGPRVCIDILITGELQPL